MSYYQSNYRQHGCCHTESHRPLQAFVCHDAPNPIFRIRKMKPRAPSVPTTRAPANFGHFIDVPFVGSGSLRARDKDQSDRQADHDHHDDSQTNASWAEFSLVLHLHSFLSWLGECLPIQIDQSSGRSDKNQATNRDQCPLLEAHFFQLLLFNVRKYILRSFLIFSNSRNLSSRPDRQCV